MTEASTTIDTQIAELFANAFTGFCGDITGMFGVTMTANVSAPIRHTGKEVKTQLGKLSAVIRIHTKGAFNEDFQIAVDRQGLFILAGVLTIRSEQEILGYCKSGSIAEADELYDAITEAGNLLAASWNRLFCSLLKEQINCSHTDTFIGNFSDESYKSLPDSEEIVYIPCEMSVAAYPGFQCGVMLPEGVHQKICDLVTGNGQKQQILLDPEDTADVEDNAQETNDDDSTANAPGHQRVPAGGAVTQAIQTMMDTIPEISPERASELFNLRACDVMEKKLLWAKPDDSVQQAVEQMRQGASGCLLVGEPTSLQGIVTRSDIVEAVSIYLRPMFAKWHRPTDDATLKIRLKIVMTAPVYTIDTQAGFADIVNALYQSGLYYLPVTNEKGHIDGMVSIQGILKTLLDLCSCDAEQSIDANRQPSD